MLKTAVKCSEVSHRNVTGRQTDNTTICCVAEGSGNTIGHANNTCRNNVVQVDAYGQYVSKVSKVPMRSNHWMTVKTVPFQKQWGCIGAGATIS